MKLGPVTKEENEGNVKGKVLRVGLDIKSGEDLPGDCDC